jgi:hypothetical protein
LQQKKRCPTRLFYSPAFSRGRRNSPWQVCDSSLRFRSFVRFWFRIVHELDACEAIRSVAHLVLAHFHHLAHLALSTFRTEESQAICSRLWAPSGPFLVGTFPIFQKASGDKPTRIFLDDVDRQDFIKTLKGS